MLLDAKSRRKLAVHVMASAKAATPATAADDGASSAANTAGDSLTNGASSGQEAITEGVLANGTAASATEQIEKEPLGGKDVNLHEEVTTAALLAKGSVAIKVIEDVWAFKRAQEVYPSPK